MCVSAGFATWMVGMGSEVEGAPLGGDVDGRTRPVLPGPRRILCRPPATMPVRADSSGAWAGGKSLASRACGQLTGQDGGTRELMPQVQPLPVWNGHWG